jgi:hypothetical protein
MALLQLAPDIQEAILFLPPTSRGRALITERELRPIAAVAEWGRQRRMWRGRYSSTAGIVAREALVGSSGKTVE